jgi:chromate transport protein ChrA
MSAYPNAAENAVPGNSAAENKGYVHHGRSLQQRLWEVTKEYLPLSVITFGGPPAHIALLHDRFVVQRKWLSETLFVELFAIGSALPGPASTQLAFSVALMRDGIIPAIWSFCLWR